MNKLKDCPFCGRDKISGWRGVNRKGDFFYYIKCDICGGQGGTAGISRELVDDKNAWDNAAYDRSVTKWNERKGDKEK